MTSVIITNTALTCTRPENKQHSQPVPESAVAGNSGGLHPTYPRSPYPAVPQSVADQSDDTAYHPHVGMIIESLPLTELQLSFGAVLRTPHAGLPLGCLGPLPQGPCGRSAEKKGCPEERPWPAHRHLFGHDAQMLQKAPISEMLKLCCTVTYPAFITALGAKWSLPFASVLISFPKWPRLKPWPAS